MPTSYIQGQWKYGEAKEAVESARAGLSPQKGDVKKSRKEKKRRDQGRREGGSSKGKVPCALNQEFLFFLFTSIWVLKQPVSVEVSAHMRLGLQGSNVRRKFRKRTTLRSKSSTLKGLLYAPIQQKQYHKRTTLRRLKIPLRSIVARKARTIAFERSTRKLSEDKRQSTYSQVWISFGDSIPGLYCVAWLTQESVSSRIFVRKKGMNHVQSNGRSQQTPSARFGKENTYR